jgi:hypothetical protein
MIVLMLILCLGGCQSKYQREFESSPSDYGSRTSKEEQSLEFQSYDVEMEEITNHNNTQLTFDQAVSNEISRMQGIQQALLFITDLNAYVAVVINETATGVKGSGDLVGSDRTITSNRNHEAGGESITLPPGTIVMDKYSFPSVHQHEGLSKELTWEMAGRIRQFHPQVRGIFISGNREFVNRMSQYAHLVWQNSSLSEEIPSFNTNVKYEFLKD